MRARTTVLVALAAAFAMPAPAASLWEHYSAATSHDAEYLGAIAELDAAETAEPIAASALLPSVGLSASIPDGDSGGSERYAATLEQQLFNARLGALHGAAKESAAAARHLRRNAEQQLILRVAEAYFGLLLAEANLRLTETREATLKEQLNVVRNKFDEDLATLTESLEAEAALNGVTADTIAARDSVAIAQRRLAQISGLNGERVADFGDYVPEGAGAGLEEWLARASAENPRLRAAQRDFAAAENRDQAVYTAIWPSVALQATRSKTNSGGTNASSQEEWSNEYFVSVSMPLFSSGRLGQEQLQSRATVEAARQGMKAVRRAAELDTVSAWRGVESGKASVLALDAAISANRSLLDNVKFGYDIGQNLIDDVLDAERNLYDAQRRHAQARHDHLLNRLRLLAAAGALREEDVREISRALAGDGESGGQQ